MQARQVICSSNIDNSALTVGAIVDAVAVHPQALVIQHLLELCLLLHDSGQLLLDLPYKCFWTTVYAKEVLG